MCIMCGMDAIDFGEARARSVVVMCIPHYMATMWRQNLSHCVHIAGVAHSAVVIMCIAHNMTTMWSLKLSYYVHIAGVAHSAHNVTLHNVWCTKCGHNVWIILCAYCTPTNMWTQCVDAYCAPTNIWTQCEHNSQLCTLCGHNVGTI